MSIVSSLPKRSSNSPVFETEALNGAQTKQTLTVENIESVLQIIFGRFSDRKEGLEYIDYVRLSSVNQCCRETFLRIHLNPFSSNPQMTELCVSFPLGDTATHGVSAKGNLVQLHPTFNPKKRKVAASSRHTHAVQQMMLSHLQYTKDDTIEELRLRADTLSIIKHIARGRQIALPDRINPERSNTELLTFLDRLLDENLPIKNQSKLNFNNLSLTSIPWEVIAKFPNVKELNLSNNSIKCELSAIQFSEKFAEQLVSIDLSNNLIDGEINKNKFDQCKKLRTLNLSQNNLHGTLDGTFLETCSELWHLDLSSNSISGQIPDYFGKNWPNLELMSLRSNQITGSPIDLIRKFETNAHSLASLEIGDNPFNGAEATVTLEQAFLILETFTHLGALNFSESAETNDLKFLTLEVEDLDANSDGE